MKEGRKEKRKKGYKVSFCKYFLLIGGDYKVVGASQVMPLGGVKNPPAKAGDPRDMCLIPGSGRSPGVENGSPLQHSCLENLMDRGAWWATVHGVTKSDKTERLSIQTHTHKVIGIH